MKQNRIRIGIIGTGSSGMAHLDVWKSMEDVDVVGFYDPDDDTASTVTEKYQLPRFLHPEIILESCDAIDITTPIEHRFSWCEKAIKMGKHVFVTSPMTHTMAEARQLLMLVEESGIKFQVEANERFNPAIIVAKQFAAIPSFLEFRLQIPFTEANFHKDISYKHLIDSINLVQSIVRSDIKNISANAIQVLSEENDVLNTRLEYQNGCVANIILNRISTLNKKTLRFFYKDGAIEIDLLQKKVEVIKAKEIKESSVFAFDIETASGNKTVITDNLFLTEKNAMETELEEFRNAILNNTKTANSETDGWIAMDIARQVTDKTGNNIFVR